MLGGDGDEVLPIEVVLLGMQLEARFVIISEVSRLRPAACLVGESAGLKSFLSTLRLRLFWSTFFSAWAALAASAGSLSVVKVNAGSGNAGFVGTGSGSGSTSSCMITVRFWNQVQNRPELSFRKSLGPDKNCSAVNSGPQNTTNIKQSSTATASGLIV